MGLRYLFFCLCVCHVSLQEQQQSPSATTEQDVRDFVFFWPHNRTICLGPQSLASVDCSNHLLGDVFDSFHLGRFLVNGKWFWYWKIASIAFSPLLFSWRNQRSTLDGEKEAENTKCFIFLGLISNVFRIWHSHKPLFPPIHRQLLLGHHHATLPRKWICLIGSRPHS